MKPKGVLFDASWRAACAVEKTDRASIDGMIKKHYLHKWPGVCVLLLVLRCGPTLLGACVFALPPRETAKRYGGVTWELARLYLEDAIPKNAETFFMARAVRYVRRHHPEVKILVSYADPSAGHSGTIYKAGNWRPDGRTDDDRRSPRCDYADAVTGQRYSRRNHAPEGRPIVRVPRVSKHRFVYFLHS